MEDMEKDCEKALQQIDKKMYAKDYDEIFCYWIAFVKKRCLVKRMISDIKVYSYFFDVITISDARAKVDLDIPRQELKRVIVINVTRPSLETELTQKEQKHYTETDLDDYTNYDYKIVNDGTLEELEEKVNEIVEDIKRRF